ncbi:MAG TPA: hypothetical protein VE093_39495 [Polyangiaceae bacterium]|jgi:hypothetical protein|nr:hypothetical protein [Polyangiaceae bacterium]
MAENEQDDDGGNPDAKAPLYKRAIDLALGLDPEGLKSYADAKRAANPELDARQLAQKIVGSFASKAAVEGFVTGLPGNPFIAVPAGVADVGYVLRCYAGLTATIGYLANEHYFDDPDWKADVYVMVSGPTVVSRALRDAGVLFGKQATKQLIRKYISKGVLKALQRAILKWFAKKVTQRMIITKTLPIIGGLIGGGWNYAELRIVGARAITYHFDNAVG